MKKLNKRLYLVLLVFCPKELAMPSRPFSGSPGETAGE